ncbi:MAG: hypothetical protein K6B17_06850 [Treponema sp.]|nr:hypothetical protein [Treponema sp.]
MTTVNAPLEKDLYFIPSKTKVKNPIMDRPLADLISGAKTVPELQTDVHELGHVIEKLNPWLAEAEKEFYNKRTAGEELKNLTVVTGIKQYGNEEICKVDNFLNPYIGKYIDGKSWEIFSIGLEHIYFTPFNGTNKDYESFIIGILLRL